MEDNAQHVPSAGADAAHAVSMLDSINATGTLHRTIPHREYRQIALSQLKYLDLRLHARALLRDDEVTALEIATGFREEDRRLQRKHLFPVHVLMQAIEVTRNILQQKRRWQALARGVAA